MRVMMMMSIKVIKTVTVWILRGCLLSARPYLFASRLPCSAFGIWFRIFGEEGRIYEFWCECLYLIAIFDNSLGMH